MYVFMYVFLYFIFRGKSIASQYTKWDHINFHYNSTLITIIKFHNCDIAYLSDWRFRWWWWWRWRREFSSPSLLEPDGRYLLKMWNKNIYKAINHCEDLWNDKPLRQFFIKYKIDLMENPFKGTVELIQPYINNVLFKVTVLFVILQIDMIFILLNS